MLTLLPWEAWQKVDVNYIGNGKPSGTGLSRMKRNWFRFRIEGVLGPDPLDPVGIVFHFSSCSILKLRFPIWQSLWFLLMLKMDYTFMYIMFIFYPLHSTQLISKLRSAAKNTRSNRQFSFDSLLSPHLHLNSKKSNTIYCTRSIHRSNISTKFHVISRVASSMQNRKELS